MSAKKNELKIEIECFEKVKAQLQSKHPEGGYVVIKGDEVLGVWRDRMDALKQGVEKYGNVSFLVRDIKTDNIPIRICGIWRSFYRLNFAK